MLYRHKAVQGALLLMFFAASFSAPAQKSEKHKLKEKYANLPEVIWRDRGDVQKLERDLVKDDRPEEAGDESEKRAAHQSTTCRK